jgi:hypothetical protein
MLLFIKFHWIIYTVYERSVNLWDEIILSKLLYPISDGSRVINLLSEFLVELG